MPDRCKICDEVVKTNHEAHLRRIHGIYDIKLAVNQYFEPTPSSTILTTTQKPNSNTNSPTKNKQKHTRSNKKGNQFS